MSNVMFASDLHLDHTYAAASRGYGYTIITDGRKQGVCTQQEIGEHNSEIIETLESQVTKRTILWILGDVAMSTSALYLLDALPCELRLVRGNHDDQKEKEYRRLFTQIHGCLRYKQFWLSHIPIHPQEMYRCRGNVHGHIHKNTNSPVIPYPYYNVNWDYHRRAVSLEEIQGWFDKYEEAKDIVERASIHQALSSGIPVDEEFNKSEIERLVKEM